jgi:Fur family ferric uptake transcriptional regulator
VLVTTIDEAITRLRAHGVTVTPARRAVVAAIFDTGEHHLTALEVVHRVERTRRRPDRATVYRTLDLLADAGVLRPVHLGTGPAIYHRTDHTHAHLVCTSCGAVVEIPAEAVDELTRLLERDARFTIEPDQIVISGLCAMCHDV